MFHPRTLLLLFFLYTNAIYGQSISSYITASAGNVYSNGNHNLSFSVGEMSLVESFSNSNITLLHGFQQPLTSIITSINSVSIPGLSIIVFPNPSNGKITLSLKTPYSIDIYGNVFDICGRKTKNFTLHPNAGSNSFLFNWQLLPAGIYFFEIIIRNNSNNIERIVTQLFVNPY